ncbi:ketoacyl-ACP synthase III [Geobacter pelophilus]|uniref:Beta-ketoacyl-[acyl-carrier-protein] synthase III n=1 Tax=Geoanaerobacter pelophilus TaxID=60036 RepID=A0AAW4L8B6_9BACT|nr:beta-ketoacyl-ACP synthase III [Geoanaerobacter pelophilus]MBT0665795.1 ketoacyl-ACP synthase III [Geoanaerobacter pelophilus]
MLRPVILGTGCAVPAKILTNADLERMVDTTDEWITSRTGIAERHIASSGEYTSTFATKAAELALEKAGVTADEIELIVVATVTPDFPFPSTACLVQNNIKASRAAAFDISAACSGFLYGLSLVEKMIITGSISKALVIGAEVLSRVVDWSDRNTCCLFGDGAGAVVLGTSQSGNGILSTHIHSDGSYWDLLFQPGIGNRNPASKKALEERLMFLQMQGNEVFKLAVRAMEDAAHEALDANDLKLDDIDLFIPHQANRRIIDAIGKRLGINNDRIFVNLHKYGNTSAASIPIALDEANRSGRIQPGNLLLLDSFGGGLTWASTLIRW